MALESVCVFCGSSPGKEELYSQETRKLANYLATSGIKAVYGGGRTGIMGVFADAVLAAGGHITGIIPTFLVEREAAHPGLSELHRVSTMHERKALMQKLSHAFIILPGGLGTLEELFEVWAWNQLGLHGKPCLLLNSGGYYDNLLAFLSHSVSQGFVGSTIHNRLIVAPTAGELIRKLGSLASS